ncbi:helix-turn-helix domain-containing protein [Shewanella algicola]|uniref:Helix-turn-helix domain-containing protein n=1 Tax=Shewanella algicola TaxID=640633 RepID=A0A9X1Z2Z5_9GAMM|nr:helix-turn-helix transcriptional regulator [Shewanella algicola]MCL1103717.1 helix-turn-helix domain-containing protein [Shewanella algicola]
MALRGFDFLRTGRELRGLTQTEVAEIYGVSERTYRRWELGEVRVPFDDVSAICDQVFRLGIDEIRMMINGES